jgi:hypothetical protein
VSIGSEGEGVPELCGILRRGMAVVCALTKGWLKGSLVPDEHFVAASRASPSSCAERVGGSVRCGEITKRTQGSEKAR